MRRDGGLQKILYAVMMILGVYILYKVGNIALDSRAVQEALDQGNVQRALEDSAMRTYAPGYTASVEGQENGSLASGFLKQLVPAYSYLAEGQADTETEDQENTGSGGTERVQSADSDGTDTRENTNSGGSKTAEDTDPAKAPEDGQAQTDESDAVPALGADVSEDLLNQLEDFDYLLSNYYIVDGSTMVDGQLLDADTLLKQDMSIEKNTEVPQILIYHTHSQEAFADSREGEVADTVVGMGGILAAELETYGYQVIHDTGVYDLVDGVLDRSAAYDYARESIEGILEENPTIEVVIDLHRDAVEGQKFVTEIDGRPTAMIMFFNGISRDAQDQPISYLQNPYTSENLAFSLQLELKAREEYPGFTRNIYLKAERFNLHLRPRSLLIEAGTQLSTLEEEQNAMIPLADLLDQVLSGR